VFFQICFIAPFIKHGFEFFSKILPFYESIKFVLLDDSYFWADTS